MRTTFRWGLFLKAIGILVLVAITFWIASFFSGFIPKSASLLALTLAAVVAAIILAMGIIKKSDSMTIAGLYGLLFLTIMQLIPKLEQNAMVAIIAIILSTLAVFDIFIWRKMFEVVWALVLVIMSLMMVPAIILIEIVIHPPSEE